MIYSQKEFDEKSQKKFLVAHQIKEEGVIGEAWLEAAISRTLTRFATETRYPDVDVDFIQKDAELGLKYANQILEKVQAYLEQVI